MPSDTTNQPTARVLPRKKLANIRTNDRLLHMPSNSRLASDARAANGKPAVFLDRDGVLNDDVGYLEDISQLKLLPGVPQALKALGSRYYLIVVTNQSGIGRGFLTEPALLAIHSEIINRLAVNGIALDALFYCPHHPEATIPDFRQKCICRKPEPGMLIQANTRWGIDLSNSYMIGDRHSDITAGRTAGTHCVWINGPNERLPSNTQSAPDLMAAALMISPDTVNINSQQFESEVGG